MLEETVATYLAVDSVVRTPRASRFPQPAMLSLAPQYLRSPRTKNLRISFEIRARGGRRCRMAITNGTAVVTAAGEKADCLITADPVRSCSSVSAGCRSSPNFCAASCGRADANHGW